MQIIPAFATPLASSELPNAAPLNAALRTLLLAREAEGDRYRNPRSSMHIDDRLFESDFNLFAWPDEPIRRLRDHCWSALGQLVGQLNGYGPQDLQRIEIQSHTWFHVTRRGGSFGLHNHPMASWSGVYCVDGGQHDADRPDSGLLRFHAPHAGVSMFADPGNFRLREPYNTQPLAMRLEAGHLVFFPSWLFHEVSCFHGEGTRITIAFNCWFKLRGG